MTQPERAQKRREVFEFRRRKVGEPKFLQSHFGAELEGEDWYLMGKYIELRENETVIEKELLEGLIDAVKILKVRRGVYPMDHVMVNDLLKRFEEAKPL